MALFNERLRGLREKSGLNQTDFAAKFELTQAQYSRYERDVAPKPDLIVLFAKELDTSADYLLGITDNPLSLTALRARLAEAIEQRDWSVVEKLIKELEIS